MQESVMTQQIDGSFPPPREFQAAALEKLRHGLRDGHRCQLLMSPTGSGKTYIGLMLAAEATKKYKRVIFACDRTTLIGQTSDTSDKYGLTNHGIIQANHWRTNLYAPFQIGSVQTLARRGWPEADLIIIDEAHTMYSAWTEHVQSCSAVVIGLSATPFSKGLGKIFSRVVNASSMHELTQAGVLVPMRVFSGVKINMEGAKTIGGEWTDGAAAKRGMEIIGDVVKEWLKVAQSRKSILFGATIGHCEAMCKQFNEAGVMAAVFSSNTTDAERDVLLKEFRKPDSAIRVLVSVEALAKGFDVPDVSCVMDCRPLRKSLSTAIQMWGRGMRSASNKEDCLLLDFSGNIVRFANDYADIYFNGISELDAGERMDKEVRKDMDEKDPPKCPECGYSPCGQRCVSCGYERKKRNLIDHEEGTLIEVSPVKKRTGFDESEIWNQVCTYTRLNGNPDTASKRAWYIYQDITGSKPPSSLNFITAEHVPVSTLVYGKIKQKQIAYARSVARGRK